MLVFADGRTVGTIGGGCYENDAFWKARESITSGRGVLLHYDLNDDFAQENGLVCGGQMDVHVDPLAPAPHLYIIGAGHVGWHVAELASATAPTDADAQDFYAKNPDKFKQGETVRASHILIEAKEGVDEATRKAARAKIDGILKRAKGGEDFAALARENSADGSAAQGGDLGFFPRGQMVPAFDQAAFALKPGEISDVVTTQFGYHIIKAVEHKDAATVPLAEVSEKVKQFLSNQKKQTKADEFIASLKQKSKIEVLI